MSTVDEARNLLAGAKAAYAAALRKVDARLHAAVCKDPGVLAEAQAVQATYGEGFTAVRTLAPLEQPPAPPEPEPVADPAPADPPAGDDTGKPVSKSVGRRLAAAMKRD